MSLDTTKILKKKKKKRAEKEVEKKSNNDLMEQTENSYQEGRF